MNPDKPHTLKYCKYHCGTLVFWDDTIQGKLRWREPDGVTIHDYPRCAELLKQQGKDVSVLKKK